MEIKCICESYVIRRWSGRKINGEKYWSPPWRLAFMLKTASGKVSLAAN
jgi:hypothetical protein